MPGFPVLYHEPLFRPPAEAYSAILQATIGCSWNRCAFCEMYTSKKFSSRSMAELKPEIELLAKIYPRTRKVFLADGNAFVLPAKKLVPILKEINQQFGNLQRISSYALPKDILSKTSDELAEIRNLGLKLLYIGIETGDEELLQKIKKGETFNSTVDGILKAHAAGIETSVMIINGLGGEKYSVQHALNSAKIINLVHPKFLSTLTLSLPYGPNHFRHRFLGEYIPLSTRGHFAELHRFISGLEVNNVIFRSNHVSNALDLEGTLNKDKNLLLEQLEQAIGNTLEGTYPTMPPVL